MKSRSDIKCRKKRSSLFRINLNSETFFLFLTKVSTKISIAKTNIMSKSKKSLLLL